RAPTVSNVVYGRRPPRASDAQLLERRLNEQMSDLFFPRDLIQRCNDEPTLATMHLLVTRINSSLS
ncbi:MAG: hypothetical protein OEV51_05805, partial [Nitrospira sp.]|nr:hypothetical protein [Nitrospira sp.]